MSNDHPRGVGSYRLNYPCPSTQREKAFADAWREENQPHRRLLELLVLGGGQNVPTPTHELGFAFENRLTRRDHAIAATVIQWLGTHVGTCFLSEVIRKCPELQEAVAGAVKSAREDLLQSKLNEARNVIFTQKEAARLDAVKIESLTQEIRKLTNLLFPPSKLSSSGRKLTLEPASKE